MAVTSSEYVPLSRLLMVIFPSASVDPVPAVSPSLVSSIVAADMGSPFKSATLTVIPTGPSGVDVCMVKFQMADVVSAIFEETRQ